MVRFRGPSLVTYLAVNVVSFFSLFLLQITLFMVSDKGRVFIVGVGCTAFTKVCSSV